MNIDSLFLQLWNSDHGHVLEACKDSLKKLRLDYLDLYLVHFPVATKHTGKVAGLITFDFFKVLCTYLFFPFPFFEL